MKINSSSVFSYILVMFFIAVILFITLILLLLYLVWRLQFAKSYRPSCPVIVYHSIDVKKGLLPTSVPAMNFQQQVEWLKSNNFKTVSAPSLLSPNLNNKQIFIGFEDSYASVAEHALPLLSKAGFTATLFLITDYIGSLNSWDVAFSKMRHMNREEITEAINKGFTIASHTKTHRDLRRLTDLELRKELEGSRLALEDTFGVKVNALSYPFGRFNDRVKAAAKDSGYTLAFTINRPAGQRKFDSLAIPATGIYSVDKLHNFSAKVNRTGLYWIDEMRDKMFNRFSCGTILIKTR